MDYSKLGVEHYFSFPSTYSQAQKKEKLDIIVNSREYYMSLKTDGNFIRAIVSPEFSGLQTRGISKVTGTYTEATEHVFFWDSIKNAFSDTTVLLGECYFEGGIDRFVSGVLRMKPHKAKSVQSEEYYKEVQKSIKFTPKDRRDIEGHEFFNKQLKYRIFDVLCYEGKDLLESPMSERQTYIDKAVSKINSPLVNGVKYYDCVPETFYTALNDVLSTGGEGLVLVKKNALYEPNIKTAKSWKTLKCKQELQETIDAVITNVIPAVKAYTGEKVETCMYWLNERTNEKLYGDYYNAYVLGDPIIPISKGYYYDWPGAIECSVYDDKGQLIPIANVAGLKEDFKEELKNNFSDYYLMPVSLSGMMISADAKTGRESGYSIRHPKLISLRTDINAEECTLQKIIRN